MNWLKKKPLPLNVRVLIGAGFAVQILALQIPDVFWRFSVLAFGFAVMLSGPVILIRRRGSLK